MALPSAAIHYIISGSTAGNVNGGAFNIDNANFLTDLTTDANTANTNSPIISSASYNFPAGDDEYWVYIKAGTDFTYGFYQIASVAGNKATLRAAIGEAYQFVRGEWRPNTVAGCATVGTPTGGTFGVNYAHHTTAILTATDYGSTGASTTLTSATGGFTPVMVGNYYHQTTTGTGAFGLTQWFEIVSYTDANNVVLDRTPNNGTASVACTGYVGGAFSLNTASASAGDDDIWEAVPGSGAAGNTWFLKGALTMGEAMGIGLAGTSALPIRVIGYQTIPGDSPTGANRTTIAAATLAFSFQAFYMVENLIITTGNSAGLTTGASKFYNCKVTNVSTSANFEAWGAGTASELTWCEGISYRGNAIENSGGGNNYWRFNWFHDSNIGINITTSTGGANLIENISSSNVTAALAFATANIVIQQIFGNTFYGAENKLGIGMSLVSGITKLTAFNNIFYGFATGVSNADAFTFNEDNWNDYNNNTANVNDVTKWIVGDASVTTAPAFTSVTQVVGTTAVILSGNRIQDDTKNFTTLGVVANATPNVGYTDYVYYSAGTGAGVKGVYAITAITTVTNPNDTITVDLTLTADATADHGYQITVGNNFLPTGSI